MQIEELAAIYSEAWANHDLESIMSLHTEDTVFQRHGPGATAVESAESVREVFAQILSETPDLRFDTKRLHFGPRHFVAEYAMSGTVDGSRIACDGVDVIAVRDGRVARKDSYAEWRRS